MTDDAAVLAAMARFGGSFVQALAGAALRADPQNLARLEAAFPDYWSQYAELAEHAASRPVPGGER